MAHTLLFTLGYNAPEDRILPENFDWDEHDVLAEALRKHGACACGRGPSTSMWRRTMRTVKGSGSHDKTGRHCLPNDPNGKMDIVTGRGRLDAR